jgi:hypothetical protein
VFVTQMDEVLKNALESSPFKGTGGAGTGGVEPKGELPKPVEVTAQSPEIRA